MAYLIAEYSKYNGIAYIGESAWNHLETKAGNVMGYFIKKYIKITLEAVKNTNTKLEPIYLEFNNNSVVVKIADNHFLFTHYIDKKYRNVH
ncbi:hypothetical protein [Planktothricoides raciborskii]|uniref:Uncharacterized protein n=1 Tax=Planktothricoides raciborskii GIHE-MW2 TaxID=2792601 RepID=A0AAU8JFL8_9CYAN